MQVWIDAQLPPSLAVSMRRVFSLDALHVIELGLVGEKDERIDQAARKVKSVVITKDSDFVHLLERLGPPPQVLWITLGNVRNAELWRKLEANWPRISTHFEAGEPLVELGRAT